MKKPKFRLVFLGAAQTVTGSMHRLEVGDEALLVDCGMYQGRRKESISRNKHISRLAVDATSMVLTHAHIDHSGNIPKLVKSGFAGKIHCTAATADLCRHMLMDSARIQEYDAAWLNRKNADDPGWIPIEPNYTTRDAEEALTRFEAHDYDEPFSPFPGVTVRLIDAGHVLGSASVVVDARMNGHSRRVVFSGDIGRRNLPILRDPKLPEHPDYVVMESTYGDRLHAPVTEMHDQLLEAIENTRERGGKIIIPSFALERTQEVVFALNELFHSGRLKPMPVYVDSPLAVNLTEVFRRHGECYDAETREFVTSHGDPFGFEKLKMITAVEDSKALTFKDDPCIIISASGMCEAGRVVHHLRNNIEDFKNTILIIGFQAQHTLGRRIVEKRRQVKIFGVPRDLNAQVRVLNAFSAHADRDELLWWAKGCGGQVRKFFMVHGDPDQCEALAEHLSDAHLKTHVPTLGEIVDLDR